MSSTRSFGFHIAAEKTAGEDKFRAAFDARPLVFNLRIVVVPDCVCVVHIPASLRVCVMIALRIRRVKKYKSRSLFSVLSRKKRLRISNTGREDHEYGGAGLRKLTEYTWHTGKLTKPVKLLVVSDLHNGRYQDILPLLCDIDALLLPGDLAERQGQTYERGIAFLREAAQVVPTFVGIGNHEMRLKQFMDFVRLVEETGARLLFNTYERFGELVIGCWYRPQWYGHEDMLPAFQAEPGCKVLMSHRPEDYKPYLADQEIDLVLSGHAHGGQWRFFGRGVFAPGQGLFPKYTRGVVERMIISAGAGGNKPVPRINNPKEILLIHLD